MVRGCFAIHEAGAVTLYIVCLDSMNMCRFLIHSAAIVHLALYTSSGRGPISESGDVPTKTTMALCPYLALLVLQVFVGTILYGPAQLLKSIQSRYQITLLDRIRHSAPSPSPSPAALSLGKKIHRTQDQKNSLSQHVIPRHISKIKIPKILGDPVKHFDSFFIPTSRGGFATENASLSRIYRTS